MERDRIDDIIKKAMEETKVQPPPPDVFWERIKKTHNEKQKKKLLLKIKRLFIAAVFICTVLVTINSLFPEKATAVGNVISRIFNVEGNGTLNNIVFEFFHESNTEQNDLQEIVTIQPETLTLEEAQIRVPFKILQPLYTPEGFLLEKVTLEEIHKPSYRVTLYYRNDKDEMLTISEENIIGETGRGYMYDKDDTLIEEISINGAKATLAKLKNKYIRVFWLNDSLSIEIFGQITKLDSIKLAESLK